jgi:Leucine-rich repeat (LRR) protein
MYRTGSFDYVSAGALDMFKDEPVTHSNEPLWPQHSDDHYGHLANALPRWLLEASPSRREALRLTRPTLRPAFKRASPQQHRELKRLNAAYWTAQTILEKRLAHLQDARTFGEPLLRQALKQQYGLDLDVRRTFLRLYIPASIPWFPVKSGAARTWTVSLLDAALHNFEPSETEDAAYEADSCFISEPTAAGQFEVLGDIKQHLSIADFTRLCRELDIGQQYQTWLDDNLGVSNLLVHAVLQPQIKASHIAALRMALELGLTGDTPVSAEAYHSMLGIISGAPGMRLGGRLLRSHDLTLMSAPLTGIVLFSPNLELNRSAVRVLAYIPDDPESPVKEYPSSAHFMADLSRKLRSPDYQRFFSRFVAHADRGYFFAELNNRLTQTTWHPHTQGDPLPTWRDEPAPHSNLQFAARPINGDLWAHLHQRQLNLILNDARTLAVSTASADRKQRWERWDSFTRIASDLLQVAAFVALPFVPFLGELMLAYTVYQVLDETFEGIIDWTEGLTLQAFEHAMGVLASLVQLGVFVAGGQIVTQEFRQVLPKAWIDFIDRFIPVKGADGNTRYWNGDLTPYARNTPLSPDSKPNDLGVHPQGKHTILPLENTLYSLKYEATQGQFRIEHPTRPEAYKPWVDHNGNGAWHSEIERPHTWHRDTLLQRLGPVADSLTLAEREQALRISGCHEDVLRQTYVDHQPLPPLLADTLKRLKIDKALDVFAAQITSQQPDIYLSADAPTQLQLLTEYCTWPERKALQLIDDTGEVRWRSANSASDGTLSYTVNPARGDVLQSALSYLDDAETKALFEESFGDSQLAPQIRANHLRRTLAQMIDRYRQSIFDSRYRATALNVSPDAQFIMDHVHGLPGEVAEALLTSASARELQQLQARTLPQRLKTLGEWTRQQVRAVRARENLERGTRMDPATATLALHSLPRLPGWSGELRIEVNRYAFSGENIDSVGAAQARHRKVLVELAEGDYQACDESGQELASAEDFYSALLHALPDSERERLSVHPGQGATLQKLLSEHALDHQELSAALSTQPLQKPEYDPDLMRLPGGNGYPKAHPGAPSLNSRVLELYPNFNLQELEAYTLALQQHPSGARVELSRLFNEYNQMSDTLRTWCQATPTQHPLTGAILDAEQWEQARQNRVLLMQALQRSWRRQTAINNGDALADDQGYLLRFTRPIIGELPGLQADFSHIAYLIFEGSESTQGMPAFLRHFTGLRRLDVRDVPLAVLPDALQNLPQLTHLVLSNCGISLNAEAEAMLSSMTRLRSLELYKNPLGRAFSIEAMPDLEYLDLADCAINTLPAGLTNLEHLRIAIFMDNTITDLPAPFFEAATSTTISFDFSGNPLSAATYDRLKIHFQTTEQDYGVMAPQADLDRTICLYPSFTREQASDFVYGLPGTLETGRLELARLEQEYATLCNDLATWSADIPPVHPLTGAPFTPQELLLEHSTRDEFKQRMEHAWRRESELDEQNDALEPTHELTQSLIISGELPSLSADFSHVSYLYLHSDAGVTTLGNGFLRCFPKLKGLTIRYYRLGNIPESVFNLGDLTALVLPDCAITLNANSVSALAGLEHLDFLDLGGNPLVLAPDVSQMPKMATLILNNTQISELPNGLLALEELEIANLSQNEIRELPSDLLELPADIAENIHLADNPFSARSLQLLHDYFKANGIDFGVEEIIHTVEVEVSDSDDSTLEE